jgi:amino acid transporter
MDHLDSGPREDTGDQPVASVTVDEYQLVQSLRWYDGFVVCLANPGFLIADLGFAVGDLGTLGAMVLWVVSMVIAVLQNQIYTEPATMFPDRAGGISIYAHEGWRRYFSFFGPMAAVGYWGGWTAVLSIFGLTIGQLIQAQWFPSVTWSFHSGIHLSLAIGIGIVLILIIWIINAAGVKPAIWVGYVTGALLMVPLILFIVVPYLTGSWHAANLSWSLGHQASLWESVRMAMIWLYLMGWSSYGVEAAATFAPEYKDVRHDTRIALRRSAMFSLAVYVLLPLGTGGVLSTGAVSKSLGISGVQFFIIEMRKMVGGGANFILPLLIISFILSMNSATMDGSRALYGISKAGMTIKWLGHVNKHHVPSRGMTVDMVVNIALILFLGSTIDILAASNFGYILTHVLCLTGVLLLRKALPGWPRPLRLSKPWLWVAGVLAVANAAFIVFGAPSFSITGYGSYVELLMGLALEVVAILLFIYRRVVEDRQPVRLRDRSEVEPDMRLFEQLGATAGVGGTDAG